MECASVNKRETLSEANKLVSNGMRKAAIDLLKEYLESDPNESSVLRTLGQAYLLDHQPEKAATYLKRSLEVKQSTNAAKNRPSKYQADEFNDDDMSYIEAEANTTTEDEFRIEIDESISTTKEREKKGMPTRRPTLHRATPEPKENKAAISNNINGATDAEPAIPKSTITSQITIPPPPVQQPSIDVRRHEELEDNDELDVSNDKQICLDGLFEDDTDGEDEDTYGEIFARSSLSSLEEDPDEFSWDDFEDLDEFDEIAHREPEEEVQGKSYIGREQRAQQIAAEVLAKSEWSPSHLPLLTQIFIENGWSAARTAIEKEIERGLLPQELALARKIRRFWTQNERYWITFHKIKTNNHYSQADATYRHMSWLEALRIISCFPSVPDITEIYDFIDEAYDHWYSSRILRQHFKAFFKYLKYHTGSMHRTLPGDCMFSFLEPLGADVGVDSDSFYNLNSPEYLELRNLGFELNQWPRPPENKMKIIKELLE